MKFKRALSRRVQRLLALGAAVAAAARASGTGEAIASV